MTFVDFFPLFALLAAGVGIVWIHHQDKHLDDRIREAEEEAHRKRS